MGGANQQFPASGRVTPPGHPHVATALRAPPRSAAELPLFPADSSPASTPGHGHQSSATPKNAHPSQKATAPPPGAEHPVPATHRRGSPRRPPSRPSPAQIPKRRHDLGGHVPFPFRRRPGQFNISAPLRAAKKRGYDTQDFSLLIGFRFRVALRKQAFQPPIFLIFHAPTLPPPVGQWLSNPN